jgi:hypothetical protein
MKRDCPSLIVEKTQFSLHLLFLLICHRVEITFDCSGSFYLWVSAMFCNVSHFLTVVTSWWRTSGCSFIYIHCVFVFHLDCYRLGCTGTHGSIFRFEFTFKVCRNIVRLLGMLFPIPELSCTILGVVLESFRLRDFPFPLFVDLVLSSDRF